MVKMKHVSTAAAMAAALSGVAFSQPLSSAAAETPAQQVQTAAAVGAISASPADALYRQARDLIDQGRYEKAIERLDKFVADRRAGANAANRADAALYWKAYGQAKLSELDDALATLSRLQIRFTGSRWLKDARALELEIRQASGQAVSPDGQPDDELKLLALRGQMASDPDHAIPMLEQLLGGASSVRVKENTLFVLSQSRAPRAREIIVAAAKDALSPDVQLRAVRYVGVFGGAESRRLLGDVYRGAHDTAVKREVLRALAAGRSADELAELARTEQEPPLRRAAIRSLGAVRGAAAGDMLRSLYTAEGDTQVRTDILNALAAHQNALALVALARAEKDPAMKKQIVARLSMLRSREASDYLLELLK